MSTTNLYRCTPRQVRRYVIRCMMAGLVPMIQSSPAMGKSAIVRAVAAEYNLCLIDHRLSTSAPEDLSGLPKFRDNDTATFAPFDTFPIEGTELPLWPGETERKFNDKGECINCYAGWLLFLDEFNSAKKEIQAAAYKLVLDKMVGLKKLHPNVAIVCAGNLSTDRAIVNPIGTAMQSRLIWLEMELNFDEFMEDVALPQKWDSRIIGYLNWKKSALHDFRPDHNEKTFCSPRTWEFMNKLISGQSYETTIKAGGVEYYSMHEETALYAGAITSATAVDFINYTQLVGKMATIKEICANPAEIDLPNDQATRYGMVCHLVENADEDNLEKVAIYINRLPSEFRILFFRSLMLQKPELKRNPAFRGAMVALSKWIHDDVVSEAA